MMSDWYADEGRQFLTSYSMAEFADVRGMDDYTTVQIDHSPSYRTQRANIPKSFTNFSWGESPSIRAGKRTMKSLTEQSFTIISEPVFAPCYTSEEEAASPIEDGESVFQSPDPSEPASSIREVSSVEDLGEDFSTPQLCSHAEAIHIVAAGKAKVVSVPKLVDVSFDEGSIAAPVSPIAAPDCIEQDYVTERTALDMSIYSSYAARSARRKYAYQLPSTTPILSTPRPEKPRQRRIQTPCSQQRAEFLSHDPFPSSPEAESPASYSSLKRRTPRFTPPFRLGSLGRHRRDDSGSSTASSSSSTSSDGSANDSQEGRLDWWNITPSPPAPAISSPQSITAIVRPKMIPRGASERAPVIVLPPCPYKYEDPNDLAYAYGTQWPLRQDFFEDELQSTSAIRHIRRKSVSAAFVTVQA